MLAASSARAPVALDLLLAKVDSLPTLPVVAHKVAELVNDPGSGSSAIAEVMQQDQALTARVLALVNSAYYGIPGGVADVRRAISYLGYNTVYQLVLTVSVFDTLPAIAGSRFNVKELWKHSLGCAITSEAVAKHLGLPKAEELFTAGLLHDIGKVALATCARPLLEQIVRDALRRGVTFRESEREAGLPGHDAVGRRLAEKWRLPRSVVAGIAFHHALEPAQRASMPQALHAIPDIVALADGLCRRLGVGHAGDEVVPDPDPRLLERLNLTQHALQGLSDELPRAIDRSKAFLEILG